MEAIMPMCPLCASKDTHVFANKNDCTIYACSSCRYRFVYPVPDIWSVYGKEYFNGASEGFGYVSYDEDKKPMIPTFEAYLRLIRTFAPTARSFIDIGAATGFFVELAADEGFDAQGIELSKAAVEEGNEKGRNVRQGTVHDIPANAFDVITMLDVLEHVPDPEADIRAARALTHTGGLLLINTPDTGSFYARLMGKRWHLLTPPEHIAYFDRQNLSMLLERNGYRVVYNGTFGKQFTLPYLFSTLYAWQGLNVWSWLANLTKTGILSRIRIPINLRDNMLVLAEAV